MTDRPWLKHYDSGVPHQIDYPQDTAFNMLEAAAQKYPHSPCTIFKGAVLTFKKIDELTDRLSAGLAALGVKKGDRVGIFMPNTPQFVIAYFAILKAGGVVVAINPLYSPREIEHQAQDAGVELILSLSDLYPAIKQAQPKTKIRTVIVTNLREYLPPLVGLLFGLGQERKSGFRISLAPGDLWMKDIIAHHKPSDRPKVDIGPDDIAMLQYSGGTTGISKGAIALHRNLVANTLQIRTWLVGTEEGRETILMAIPLYHVYGMVLGMLFAMRLGAAMVLIRDPRDLKDILTSIQKYKTSIFPGVPNIYNAINNHPDVLAGKYKLDTIKACISGSTPLLKETKDKFEARTGGKLIEGYGLSEAPTATHINPMFGENRPGSIGLPLPDVEARIVSLEDGATTLPAGQIGELVLRGPQVMKGYHNMPRETDNTLRDGWLYTGDIARMDKDGYFYIVDRKKELIKPGGYQVWPREVEEVIAMHPNVREVGVAGIFDPEHGEMVKAWVVLKPGQSMREEELREFCKQNMAVYKVPTLVEFRSALPKTTVGKVLRRELVREHVEATKKTAP
ncbi:MAG TPA: long-chain fatty acid--CoA ligase [Anaerolineales bacterium]|nr:long-chain fatty acid--CoA ligase [Anaerolineales bacterium]